MNTTSRLFDRFRSRMRRGAAVAVVAGAVLMTGLVLRTSASNIDRIELIDERLRETGQFSEARRRIQRLAFQALPGGFTPESALISDLRLQLEQAEQLGNRLPPQILDQIKVVRAALSEPVVYRDDLVAASRMLEEIVDAEAFVQARILEDARAGMARDRAFSLMALAGLALLAILGLWVVPDRLLHPLRHELQRSTRQLLERERALTRAQQLAVLGEKAADLAHEVRNPLAGVIMGLHNVESEVPQIGARVAPMISELERASRTLSGFMAEVHGTPEVPRIVEPDALVSELADLLRHQTASSIQVVVNAERGRATLRADATQQVLLNLGLNGIQAMEERGGRLTLEARFDGDDVVFEVRDEGPGFHQDLLTAGPRKFESAKPGGSGLGLSIVDRLVRTLGASLALSNSPRSGAIAQLTFPNVRTQG